MTLASKTADILALATQGINHLISGQDALASADERKSVLTQLSTAMQTAAKLADVVHMEAVAAQDGRDAAEGRGGDAEGLMTEVIIRAETARLQAEAEKIERETNRAKAEAERAVVETERLKAGAMMVRSVKLKIDSETERVKMETQGEAEKAAKEAERAVTVTEQLKAEAVMVGGENTKIDPRTEKVKAETEQTKAENQRVGEEGESWTQQQEGHTTKPENYLEELDAQIARKQMQMTIECDNGRWWTLRDEVVELRSKKERERVRRM